MNHKWEILKLNVVPSLDGLESVVKSVNWRFTVQEEMHYGDVYSVTELTYPKTESFIRYEDLTEETVIDWIKNNIDYSSLLEKATTILENNKNPKILEKDPPFEKKEKYTGNEEYLIVIDNDLEKRWGPFKWNSNRANNGLIHYGITDYKFPFDIIMYQKELLPDNTPFRVNERITLYKVEYTQKPKDYNELLEYTDNLSWITDSGKAVGTYFIRNRTVDELKELLIEKTLAKYNDMRYKNLIDFEFNNKIYKVGSDYDTILLLFFANLTLNNRETAVIKLPNSLEYIEFNKELLDSLSNTIYNHLDNIIQQERTTVELIKSSSTIEELIEIEV
jgi:hypothetical protein